MQNVGMGSGVDGQLTISSNTTETVIDSACTGTGGTTTLSATNAGFADDQLILIHQTRGTGAGSWELNFIDTYSAGTITTQFELANTYATGAQVRKVPQYSGVTIQNSVTYTGKAWNGTVGGIMAMLVSGHTQIDGTISLLGNPGTNSTSDQSGTPSAGGGFRGGKNSTDGSAAGQGEGYTGTYGTESTSNAGNGGGAADGSSGGLNDGAGGGNAVAGSNSSRGTGGVAVGSSSLTSMFFGGGGGGGRNDTGSGAAGGGSGGGIVFIQTQTIAFGANGLITVHGGNGGNGGNHGNGGGGAGGCIYLRFAEGSIGTNQLDARGGTGGNNGGTSGGDGGNGYIRVEACNYTGSTSFGSFSEQEGGHTWCQSFIHVYGTN